VLIPLLLILAVAACLLLEAFFSGSETAIISADKAQLRAAARHGDQRAAVAEDLLERSETLLSTTLVGTNLAVVTSTSLATLLVGHYVSGDWESAVTTLIMAPLILIVGEIVPKSVARASADTITLRVAPLLALAQRAMRPLVAFVGWIASWALSIVGSRDTGDSPYVSREELLALAEIGEEHGLLDAEELRMIQGVLELRDRPVASVMVPLADMASVPLDASVADLEQAAARTGFSRFPVYEERIDNIVGIVSFVDVLRCDLPGDPAATPLAPYVRREVAFVPETKPVGELLRELRYSLTPMAIVVEERGGVVGLATVNDLVEEIVGRIRDERLEGPADLIERDSLAFECDGKMAIDELAELTGLTIRKEGFETVSGLVLKLTGRIPQAGQSLELGPFRIDILEATPRQVRRLRFTRTEGKAQG